MAQSALLQSLSMGNYGCVINVPVTGISRPKRDSSNSPVALTADIVVETTADSAGINVASWTNFFHSSAANAGQLLKTGVGVLGQVVIGTHNTGASISLYDALSATNLISTISSTSGVAPTSLTFNYQFQTGLYVVTAGSGFDFTVLWN